MGDPKIFIHELEILINQQVRYVLGMAARCPRGGCEEWDRLLNRYGVEKIQGYGNSGRTIRGARGANPAELRAVLEAIRGLALPALSHIEFQYASAIASNRLLASWVRRINERLTSLHELAEETETDTSWNRAGSSWSQAAAL